MGSIANCRSRFCLFIGGAKKNDAGAMLVEVLVSTLILLMVFAGVVQQISNLATTRVRIETRDRAVAYVNSLHQVMSANGCGFDVDTVEETIFVDQFGNPITQSGDSFAGSDQVTLKGPWDRVQGCAFKALERVHDSDEGDRANSYVDQNDVVHLSVNDDGSPSVEKIDKATAKKFCSKYGEAGSQYSDVSCELGDQEFTHKMVINDEGTTTDFKVKVSYWFEVVGGTTGSGNSVLNRKSTCAEITSSNKMPDTLARKVEVSFPNGRGKDETIAVTKRENVPVDSFQFASGTRVGVVSLTGAQVSMYPSPGLNDPWKVTRIRESSDSCIWFPYISRHSAGDLQPTFSVDNSGAQEATLSKIPALGTGTL